LDTLLLGSFEKWCSKHSHSHFSLHFGILGWVLYSKMTFLYFIKGIVNYLNNHLFVVLLEHCISLWLCLVELSSDRLAFLFLFYRSCLCTPTFYCHLCTVQSCWPTFGHLLDINKLSCLILSQLSSLCLHLVSINYHLDVFL
jgi:hypothetical protein